MGTTYYVDTNAGSDANAGLTTDGAFKTLAAIEQIRLQPGDTVLLARGSTFTEQLDIKQSGFDGAPITFGAYGEGDAPVITGGANGIHGSKTNYIVVRDLTITETSGNAIYAGAASNWIIDNVTIVDAEGGPTTDGISYQFGVNLTVKNSTIQGVNSDGIWIDETTGIVIENNTIGTVRGATSDNIQIVNSENVVLRGNALDMTGETDSTKGNLAINKSVNVVIEDNTLAGGTFGASVNADNVVVTGNEIYGQSGYTWTYGIGLGERWDVSNYVISGNYIHDVRFGVAITGIGDTAVMRNNIEVTGNTFEHIEGAALKVDRPASGSFDGNLVNVDSAAIRIPQAILDAGTFVVGENESFGGPDPSGNPPTVTTPAKPVAVDDGMRVDAAGMAAGNVLANDYDPNGGPIYLRTLGSTKVANREVMIEGKYGDLFFFKTGSYRYDLDETRIDGSGGVLKDTFFYKISDGAMQDTGSLTLTIDLATLAIRDDLFGLT